MEGGSHSKYPELSAGDLRKEGGPGFLEYVLIFMMLGGLPPSCFLKDCVICFGLKRKKERLRGPRTASPGVPIPDGWLNIRLERVHRESFLSTCPPEICVGDASQL